EAVFQGFDALTGALIAHFLLRGGDQIGNAGDKLIIFHHFCPALAHKGSLFKGLPRDTPQHTAKIPPNLGQVLSRASGGHLEGIPCRRRLNFPTSEISPPLLVPIVQRSSKSISIPGFQPLSVVVSDRAGPCLAHAKQHGAQKGSDGGLARLV